MITRILKRLLDILHFPFYLWLLGIFPILHLYTVNFGLVKDHEVPLTIAGMLIATSLAYILADRFSPNKRKRAFYLGIWSLYFSLSGHIYVMIFIPRSLLVWNIATSVGLILLCAVLQRFMPRHSYGQITFPFNVVMATLVALQVGNLISNFWAARGYEEASDAFIRSRDEAVMAEKGLDSAERPDIYYIIPDGYPSDSWLQNAMNCDNSAFTKALESRGFVVVDHAQSNYGVTLLSLSSVLNM